MAKVAQLPLVRNVEPAGCLGFIHIHLHFLVALL